MKKLSLIFGTMSLCMTIYWLYRGITHAENSEMEWLIFSLFLLLVSIYGVVQNIVNYIRIKESAKKYNKLKDYENIR